MGGKAHGVDRIYQELCRDVLIERRPGLRPLRDDGIDVPIQCLDTTWNFDVALQDADKVVLAECRRFDSAIKQEHVGAFAYRLEQARCV